MPLEATPAQASRYLAVLDALMEQGTDIARRVYDRAEQPGADPLAVALAFDAIARCVRRTIMLACSLETLAAGPARAVKPAPAPGPLPPLDPPRPQAPRGEGVERGDRLDTLPDLPLPELVDLLQDEMAAAAALVEPAPTPPTPTPPTPTPPAPARASHHPARPRHTHEPARRHRPDRLSGRC